MSRTARTIDYYQANAGRYADRFGDIDVSHLYARFLQHVRSGGRILDAGCGTGRDSRAFEKLDYQVTAFDASSEMLSVARELFDGPLHHLCFDEVTWKKEFDGVWSMASLLHVPRLELSRVVTRLSQTLVPGGVFYMSFKQGTEDRTRDGRLFTDYDEPSLTELVRNVETLKVHEVWTSEDVLSPERPSWVNCIALRKPDA